MPLQQTTIVHGDASYAHYYLCNYLPVSAGTDPLSLSLLKFKRGRQPDLNAWIDCSLELLDEAFTPPGNSPTPLNSLHLPPLSPDTIFLRALHHDETSTRKDNPGALDKLGKTLADHFHSHYCPRLLRKSSPTPEIKGLSKEQRVAELKNRYYIDTRYFPAPPSPPSFLLLDDILTTGTTMKMIIDALLHPYPKANIVVFTLAKADYDNFANHSLPLRGQNYPIGQPIQQTLVEERTNSYSSNDLKSRIRTDTF